MFSNVNVESIKEVLPKISVYNETIARYMEGINLKYDITLSYMHLEVSEIGHWPEMFQMATCSNDQPQPSQPRQQTFQVTTTSPEVQALLHRDQQAEIDRLTSVAAQWLTGSHVGLITQTSTTTDTNLQDITVPQISLVPQNYSRQHMYNDNQGEQRHSNYDRRSQQYNRQEADQRRYPQNLQHVGNNNVNVLNALEKLFHQTGINTVNIECPPRI